MRNKRSKKRLYLTGFLASILITSPSIANPSIKDINEGSITNSSPIKINEGSLANNYPMKMSEIMDKKSWMKECYQFLAPVVDKEFGLSGRNVCKCMWNKLETPWYDANSQVEINAAGTLCILEQMKGTRPY